MENNNNRKEKIWLSAVGIIMVLIVLFAMSDQVVKSKNQKISYCEQSSQKKMQEKPGRWIYKGTHIKENLQQKEKEYFEQILEKWISGFLTDAELTDWMMQRLRTCEIDIQAIGIMSQQRCVFESEEDIPDYETRLQDANSIYEFIGLYTDGETDAEGKLICYYWEAGIK